VTQKISKQKMTPWKTDLSIARSRYLIGLNDSLLTIGSCFSQGIGKRLNENKFNVLINPFGTTYNPISIHHSLQLGIQNEMPKQEDYLIQGEVHYHYQFHSSLASLQQAELEKQLNQSIAQVNQFIKSTKFLIITYGSAWAFRRKDTNQWVNNCHKMPASNFYKELLSLETIRSSFQDLLLQLKTINPSLQIILTVSPVRHIKDTLELNAVSKSVLRLFCHQAVQDFGVDYFPAYEIMMDDLRDYRFYKEDQIHPTQQAEEYIWGKFVQKYGDANTLIFLETWKDIRSALNHRSSFPATRQHQAFLHSTLTKLEQVAKQVNVQKEINWVNAQLINK
jgi:hypothetical protein